MSHKLRLAFMGTPDFAIVALRALQAAGHDIACVYTQPPKPAGRGKQIQKSAVHIVAEEAGLAVRTPKNLRDAEEQKFFAALNLDAVVVVAYGLILPQAFLDAPRLGCINVHFSLLPRWRGAMPVQHALLAGDQETGVDIMHMAAGLDTGAILMRDVVPITPATTTPDLLDELSKRGARMIVQVLQGLAMGTLKSKPQSEQGATYAAKLTREDGRIDWRKSAVEIDRQVRALQPWPGTFFMLGDEPVKVLKAEIISGKFGAPGSLLDDRFTVACAKDALRLVTVQRAGKSATDGASFLRGLKLPVNDKSGIKIS
jgi:methionyl-tRNA formyltransferase